MPQPTASQTSGPTGAPTFEPTMLPTLQPTLVDTAVPTPGTAVPIPRPTGDDDDDEDEGAAAGASGATGGGAAGAVVPSQLPQTGFPPAPDRRPLLLVAFGLLAASVCLIALRRRLAMGRKVQ
jgi:hypothetical protein